MKDERPASGKRTRAYFPNRPPRPCWLLPPVRETKREARKKGKGGAAG